MVKNKILYPTRVPMVEITANDLKPTIKTKIQRAHMTHLTNTAENNVK